MLFQSMASAAETLLTIVTCTVSFQAGALFKDLDDVMSCVHRDTSWTRQRTPVLPARHRILSAVPTASLLALAKFVFPVLLWSMASAATCLAMASTNVRVIRVRMVEHALTVTVHTLVLVHEALEELNASQLVSVCVWGRVTLVEQERVMISVILDTVQTLHTTAEPCTTASVVVPRILIVKSALLDTR
jgi:hypothetical protein